MHVMVVILHIFVKFHILVSILGGSKSSVRMHLLTGISLLHNAVKQNTDSLLTFLTSPLNACMYESI